MDLSQENRAKTLKWLMVRQKGQGRFFTTPEETKTIQQRRSQEKTIGHNIQIPSGILMTKGETSLLLVRMKTTIIISSAG
jgi:hypothetical protein